MNDNDATPEMPFVMTAFDCSIPPARATKTPTRYMLTQDLLHLTTYDPNALFDEVKRLLRLKNDAALCNALEIVPPVISKMRHRKGPVGAAMLIGLHEITGMSIRDLRRLMGDNRKSFCPPAPFHRRAKL
jgi:hypothetical protein